jgi:imidazolonepropionase-like amidohydrolase
VSRILLRNARVLVCSGDPTEQTFDGDVLLDGERIGAVTHGRLAVDETSTRVIDVGGATVLPGLGDAHAHISWPLDFVFDHAAVARAPVVPHTLDVAAVCRTYRESGYTTIVGAGVLQPFDDVAARDAIDRGLIAGPRIVPSGLHVADPEGLGGDGVLTQLAGDARELRAVVAQQCASGVEAVKLFVSGDGVVPEHPSQDVYMSDEMLLAAVDEAARHGAFVTTHARSAPSVAMAARTGVKVIHHACFLDDDAVAALEARRDDVFVCPGLHYLYAMVHGHAEPWGITPEALDASGYRTELDAQVDGLRRLIAAGVRVVAGGDFGHQWTRHGTYAAELQRYVELVGMTPVEAILTATRNVGLLTGADTGEVRTGFLADLLVVDGDPTTDVAVLQDHDARRLVVKGGAFAYVNPARYP